MRRPVPSTPPPRAGHAGRRPSRHLAAGVLAIALAVSSACASTGTVETGDGAGDGTGSGLTTPSPTQPSVRTVPPANGGSATTPGSSGVATPPTTCVDGPATTTPWDAGGGRTTCSTVPPDGSVSSPPMTDTTIPLTTSSLAVDEAHGVVVVSAAGGYECPADEPCPAIAMLMSGTVSARAPGGTSAAVVLDGMGRAGFRLDPGDYEISAEVVTGSCAPTTATAVAGTAVYVSLACSVPMP